MDTNWLRYTPFFLILVLLQIWVLNKINLFQIATPFFFIYFILKLPADLNRNWVLLLSFLTGFTIDFFEYSLGVNMFACTIMGFSRFYILNAFAPRDMAGAYVPSIRTFGVSLFMRYAFILTLIHHIIVYFAEDFSLSGILFTCIRILGSSLLTLLLIFGSEQLNLEFLKK